uniref:Putative movement protein n=1 Tax=Cherry virus A TaxID=42882 RepID=A0A679GB98_9VIRU|nr:putative movement protein [Cherry virus A]BCA25834.1 putative movement protein [Cherry virus A]
MSIIPVKKFLQRVAGDESRIFIDAIRAKDIYSDANAFNSKVLTAVKRFQSSIAIPASCTGESNVTQFNIFDEIELEAIKKASTEYSMLHLGAIIICVTCFFKLKKTINGKIVYFDPRFLDKNDACQAGFSFQLQTGSAYYLYRPNYPMSTHDPNMHRAARIKFEFDAINVVDNSHLFFIDFGVMYQLSNQSTAEKTTAADVGAQFQALFGSSGLPNPESFLENEDIINPPTVALIDVSVDQSFRKGGFFKGPPRSTRARRYHARSKRQGFESIPRSVGKDPEQQERNLFRSNSCRSENFQFNPEQRFSVDQEFINRFDKCNSQRRDSNLRYGSEHSGAELQRDKKGPWKLHLGEYDRSKGSVTSDCEAGSGSLRGDSSNPSDYTVRKSEGCEEHHQELLLKGDVWESCCDGDKRTDRLPRRASDDPETSDRESGGSDCSSPSRHVIINFCHKCEGMGCSWCRG